MACAAASSAESLGVLVLCLHGFPLKSGEMTDGCEAPIVGPGFVSKPCLRRQRMEMGVGGCTDMDFGQRTNRKCLY